MTDSLAIALAQLNPTVGDVDGNVALIRAARADGARAGADLVATGELAVAGYPPEDLVLKPAFLDRCAAAVAELRDLTRDGGPALIVGAPERAEGKVYNTAFVLADGAVLAGVRKHELPNYGVFDERRVYAAGPLPEPVAFKGARLGVMVCEDMWIPEPAAHLSRRGTDLLVVLNGSPFEVEKEDTRLRRARARVAETGVPLVYVNQVGGQDELVFDGASFALDAMGRVAARAPSWREDTLLVRAVRGPGSFALLPAPIARSSDGIEAIYRAMVTGLRDYVNKNRFPGVLIGLSGGVDSALSAAVAADALGPDRVRCVMMPSPFTSRESLDDAAQVAALLGVRLDSVSIEPAMRAFEAMLRPLFEGRANDTTEENIQARARGIALMALSNKFGHMVLSTGNKSEMSVGYATLYGDMCGGYSVLKDIYKTTVFALSRFRNRGRPEGLLGPSGAAMPERVIAKPPTAELKPNQTDQDTLPPYEVLDAILRGLVEDELALEQVAAQGFDPAIVKRVWTMLDRAEYKRRQAPPGVKITRRAFGRDRRYPITNGFAARL